MGKLEQKRKDTILHCLLTGKLRIKVGQRYYYLVQQEHQVRVLAAIEYENCLYSLRFEPWLTKKSMLEILVNRGIISSTIEQQLFSLHKRLEDLKVDLYRSTFNTSNDKKIRHDIELVREKIRELENAKNSLYYMTIEGYSAHQKLLILLAGSIYREISNERVYTLENGLDDIDYSFLDRVIQEKTVSEPKDHEIREVSRTNPWRGLWSIDDNPLHKGILDLTEYQQSLYMYSHLYDNIRESSDCPPDTILDDDDKCDGWLIMQSRKVEKDRQEKQVDDIIGKSKVGNHQQIFMPAKTQEDVKRIQDMNDMGTKIVLAQRKKQIEQKGEVREVDLMDNRIKVAGMVTEAKKTHMKGT